MEEKNIIPATIFKSMNLLHIAILAGSLLYFIVAFYLNKTEGGLIKLDRNLNQIFWSVSVILLLGMIPAAYYIFKKKIEKIRNEKNLNEKMNHYREAFIIKLAIIDTACFFNITFFLLSNVNYILYQIAILLLVLAINFPNKTAITDELELNIEGNNQK